MVDLLISNLELCEQLQSSPLSALVMMFLRWLVVSLRSLPIVISAMLSTYPIASLASGLSGVSMRSALKMIYRSIDRGSTWPIPFEIGIGSEV